MGAIGTTFGTGFLGGVISGAIAGGAAGFVGGTLGATLHGANLSQIGRSALMGARTGAIAGAVAGGVNWAGGQLHVQEIVSKMAGAGLSSTANGGNMERNVQSIIFAGFGYSAHKAWNNLTNNRPDLDLQGGPRGGLLGEAKAKGPLTEPYSNYGNMGFQGSTDSLGHQLSPPSPSEARFYFGFDEGSLGSRLGNFKLRRQFTKYKLRRQFTKYTNYAESER